MKKNILYLLLIPLLVCCTGSETKEAEPGKEGPKKAAGSTVHVAGEGNYLVSGTCDVSDGTKVRIFNFEYPYGDIAESTVQNGQFVIEKKFSKPRLVMLDIAGEPIVLEGGAINVGFDANGRFYRKGTPMNDALQSFFDMASSQKINEVQLEKLLRSNIKNPVGAYILPRVMSVFDVEVLKKLAAEVPAEYRTKEFNEAVEQIETNVEYMKIAEQTAVGKSYVNFELPDINGNKVLFSTIVNSHNYTLLDFWASWCAPCRMEMPRVKSIYEKFFSKGVAVVSLSLDSSVADWKTGVSQLGMTWTQLCDPRAGSTEVAGAYGIRTIPHFVLIDNSGKIILRTSLPEEVEALLEVLTKNKQ